MKSTSKRWRVVIADDHALVRQGIRMLIDAQPDMEVVAEANDGEEALNIIREVMPDVVVLDVSMPKLNGAQVMQRMRSNLSSVRVLGVSAYSDDAHVNQLLAAGASGYLLKKAASDDLTKAIRTVAEGGVYLDPNVTGKVVEGKIDFPANIEGNDTLTPTEVDILKLVAYGHSNINIASKLHFSVKTIEGYKNKINSKLGFKSRAELVLYAIQRGWLSSDN